MTSINFEKLADALTEVQIIAESINPAAQGSISINTDVLIPYMKILVLARSADSTVGTGINTGLSSFGYQTNVNYDVTFKILNSSYTGSGDITTPVYNIVVVVGNSTTQGAASFGTNLNNYVNNGGHLILSTFAWNLRIDAGSVFDYTNNSALTFSGNQSNDTNNVTLTVNQSHPIVTNAGISLNIGSDQYNGSVALTTNAVRIASFPSTNEIGIAIRQKGKARLVGLNFFPSDLTNAQSIYVNRRNIFVNSILWCAGYI